MFYIQQNVNAYLKMIARKVKRKADRRSILSHHQLRVKKSTKRENWREM